MVRLYIEDPQGSVKNPELEGDEITIGRAADNTIVLPDRNISRHHLRMFRDGKAWMVEDAGSRYGVEYMEEPLEGAQKLVPKAYLVIGDYRIKLVSDTGTRVDQDQVSQMFAPEKEADRTTTEEFISPHQATPSEDIGEGMEWPEEEEPHRKSGKGLFIGLAVVVLIVLVGGYAWINRTTGKSALGNKEIAQNQPQTGKKAMGTEGQGPEKKVRVAASTVKDARLTEKAPDAAKQASKTPPTRARTGAIQPEKRKNRGMAKAPAAPKPKVVKSTKKITPRPKPPPRKIRPKAHKKAVVAMNHPARHRKHNAMHTKPAPAKTIRSGGAAAMLKATRNMRGAQKLRKLRECLAKYGNKCCKAHKYIADYYLGTGVISQAISQLKLYRSCTTDLREKNRARRSINRLQGL